MKIVNLETFPVRVAYTKNEVSSVIDRGGIAEVIIRLTTEDGLIGWGEAQRAADVAGIESAIKAMAPLVVGRNAWDREAIQRDVYGPALWHLQPMTANFAYAAIDMALWDLAGKATGQPLYRLLGGALREEVDYFYYLSWGTGDEIAAQAKEGLGRGYSVFYIKTGVDERREEAMLEALRSSLGPDPKIRIDSNQAWSVPDAVRLLNRWHARFELDFAEAPVPIEPQEIMADLKSRVSVPLSANEGCWREVDVNRIIKSRCADVLAFGNAWVGSIRRFLTAAYHAELEGLLVCKHCHGELGISAAAGQHMMLACPNAVDGNQQLAYRMADDILTELLPIATGPKWGRIDKPGLGIEVDMDKLMRYHENYRKLGGFPPYGNRFGGNA